MKSVRSIIMLAVLLVTISVRGHEEDTMTRLDHVPTQGVTEKIAHCMSEHAWCFLALTAMAGYIYVNSVLASMKPNPCEGQLKEANQKIAELEAALLKFDQMYKMFMPVLRLAKPNLFPKPE